MDPRILARLMDTPWVGVEPPPVTIDGMPYEPNAVPMDARLPQDFHMPQNAGPAIPPWDPMGNRARMAEVEQMRNPVTLPNGDLQVMRPQGQQQPSTGRRILNALPSILQSGIAAAATPNIAGGGPTDVFRAMEAGNDALMRRDLAAWNMQQQRQAAADNQRLRQSQMDYNRARTANAMRDKPKPPTFAEKFDALVKMGIPREKAMVIASGGTLQDSKPASTTQQRPTIVSPGSTVLGPDGKPIYTAPGRPQNPQRPATPHYVTAEDGTVHAVTVGPDGKPVALPVPGVKARVPKDKDGSDKPRMGTPAQFASVEHRKVQGFQKAKDELEKAIKGSTDITGKPVGLSEAEKAEARRIYDEKMQALQEAYEQEIIALGGSVAKPAAGATGTPNSASSYLKKKFGGQ